MKKKGIILIIFALFILQLPFVFPVSRTDFDDIIDFSVTLEVLSRSLESGNYDAIDTNKLVLLNGTMSVVKPAKSNAFFLSPDDFPVPSNFILKLKNGKDPLSRMLMESVSDQLRTKIKAYGSASSGTVLLVRELVAELNTIIENGPLYEPSRLKSVVSDKDLLALASSSLSGEDVSFVNRLILESAYPGDLKKFEVRVEILYGTWVGYDEVKSYKTIITFTGTETFKLYRRKSTRNVSGAMIDVNATVLIVAQIIEPITLVTGEKAWHLNGVYIREIK
ncbi:MAG: hypothetical protein JW881_05225 [Spirochaetales bacterium]|nr:hypothetical protein [Spirochaetales bacterium]